MPRKWGGKAIGAWIANKKPSVCVFLRFVDNTFGARCFHNKLFTKTLLFQDNNQLAADGRTIALTLGQIGLLRTTRKHPHLPFIIPQNQETAIKNECKNHVIQHKKRMKPIINSVHSLDQKHAMEW